MYTYIHRHVLACERGYVYYAYEKDSERKSEREQEREREKKREKKRARLVRTYMFVYVRACACLCQGARWKRRDVQACSVYACVCVWEACVVRRHARTRVCVANYVIQIDHMCFLMMNNFININIISISHRVRSFRTTSLYVNFACPERPVRLLLNCQMISVFLLHFSWFF